MQVVEVIKEVLPWLEKGAALTATQIDDAVVQVFKAAIDNPTIAAWIDSLFQADAADRMTMACAASPEVQEAFAAKGIDWQKVVALLPTVLKIIALFAK